MASVDGRLLIPRRAVSDEVIILQKAMVIREKAVKELSSPSFGLVGDSFDQNRALQTVSALRLASLLICEIVAANKSSSDIGSNSPSHTGLILSDGQDYFEKLLKGDISPEVQLKMPVAVNTFFLGDVDLCSSNSISNNVLVHRLTKLYGVEQQNSILLSAGIAITPYSEVVADDCVDTVSDVVLPESSTADRSSQVVTDTVEDDSPYDLDLLIGNLDNPNDVESHLTLLKLPCVSTSRKKRLLSVPESTLRSLSRCDHVQNFVTYCRMYRALQFLSECSGYDADRRAKMGSPVAEDPSVPENEELIKIPSGGTLVTVPTGLSNDLLAHDSTPIARHSFERYDTYDVLEDSTTDLDKASSNNVNEIGRARVDTYDIPDVTTISGKTVDSDHVPVEPVVVTTRSASQSPRSISSPLSRYGVVSSPNRSVLDSLALVESSSSFVNNVSSISVPPADVNLASPRSVISGVSSTIPSPTASSSLYSPSAGSSHLLGSSAVSGASLYSSSLPTSSSSQITALSNSHVSDSTTLARERAALSVSAQFDDIVSSMDLRTKYGLNGNNLSAVANSILPPIEGPSGSTRLASDNSVPPSTHTSSGNHTPFTPTNLASVGSGSPNKPMVSGLFASSVVHQNALFNPSNSPVISNYLAGGSSASTLLGSPGQLSRELQQHLQTRFQNQLASVAKQYNLPGLLKHYESPTYSGTSGFSSGLSSTSGNFGLSKLIPNPLSSTTSSSVGSSVFPPEGNLDTSSLSELLGTTTNGKLTSHADSVNTKYNAGEYTTNFNNTLNFSTSSTISSGPFGDLKAVFNATTSATLLPNTQTNTFYSSPTHNPYSNQGPSAAQQSVLPPGVSLVSPSTSAPGIPSPSKVSPPASVPTPFTRLPPQSGLFGILTNSRNSSLITSPAPLIGSDAEPTQSSVTPANEVKDSSKQEEGEEKENLSARSVTTDRQRSKSFSESLPSKTASKPHSQQKTPNRHRKPPVPLSPNRVNRNNLPVQGNGSSDSPYLKSPTFHSSLASRPRRARSSPQHDRFAYQDKVHEKYNAQIEKTQTGSGYFILPASPSRPDHIPASSQPPLNSGESWDSQTDFQNQSGSVKLGLSNPYAGVGYGAVPLTPVRMPSSPTLAHSEQNVNMNKQIATHSGAWKNMDSSSTFPYNFGSNIAAAANGINEKGSFDYDQLPLLDTNTSIDGSTSRTSPKSQIREKSADTYSQRYNAAVSGPSVLKQTSEQIQKDVFQIPNSPSHPRAVNSKADTVKLHSPTSNTYSLNAHTLPYTNNFNPYAYSTVNNPYLDQSASLRPAYAASAQNSLDIYNPSPVNFFPHSMVQANYPGGMANPYLSGTLHGAIGSANFAYNMNQLAGTNGYLTGRSENERPRAPSAPVRRRDRSNDQNYSSSNGANFLNSPYLNPDIPNSYLVSKNEDQDRKKSRKKLSPALFYNATPLPTYKGPHQHGNGAVGVANGRSGRGIERDRRVIDRMKSAEPVFGPNAAAARRARRKEILQMQNAALALRAAEQTMVSMRLSQSKISSSVHRPLDFALPATSKVHTNTFVLDKKPIWSPAGTRRTENSKFLNKDASINGYKMPYTGQVQIELSKEERERQRNSFFERLYSTGLKRDADGVPSHSSKAFVKDKKLTTNSIDKKSVESGLRDSNGFRKDPRRASHPELPSELDSKDMHVNISSDISPLPDFTASPAYNEGVSDVDERYRSASTSNIEGVSSPSQFPSRVRGRTKRVEKDAFELDIESKLGLEDDDDHALLSEGPQTSRKVSAGGPPREHSPVSNEKDVDFHQFMENGDSPTASPRLAPRRGPVAAVESARKLARREEMDRLRNMKSSFIGASKRLDIETVSASLQTLQHESLARKKTVQSTADEITSGPLASGAAEYSEQDALSDMNWDTTSSRPNVSSNIAVSTSTGNNHVQDSNSAGVSNLISPGSLSLASPQAKMLLQNVGSLGLAPANIGHRGKYGHYDDVTSASDNIHFEDVHGAS